MENDKNKKEDIATDRSQRPDKGFLVSEKHDDVDASGVDDKSTGMGEGDSDFLGKTNKENGEDE